MLLLPIVPIILQVLFPTGKHLLCPMLHANSIVIKVSTYLVATYVAISEYNQTVHIKHLGFELKLIRAQRDVNQI